VVAEQLCVLGVDLGLVCEILDQAAHRRCVSSFKLTPDRALEHHPLE
jgi:hypothetical protein